MISQNLATLIQAVIQVSPELVSNCRTISEEDEIKYVNERSFAYELYRQWQNLVEGNVDGLIVNAEVTKKCEEKKFLRKLCNIFGFTKDGKPHSCFYPDLVYHHSQGDNEKQEVICEVKTKDGIGDTKNDALIKDLLKLAAYMTNKCLLYHPFKIGVFILVGGSFIDIIQRYKSKKSIKNKEYEIFCITYKIIKNKDNLFVPMVECMSLYEILELKRKK